MKKTPAILMTTALLSVPCAEGVAQKPTTAPIITPSATRTIVVPTWDKFQNFVGEYAISSINSQDISFGMFLVNDLGYDSLNFELLLLTIEEEFSLAFSCSPISNDLPFLELTVGDLWDFVLEEWEGFYGK